MDDQENQHNEHKDLMSHSASQPQDHDLVQPQVIVKKSTFSKLRAPETVILRDSIVKNIYGNMIAKSMKHQKHIVAKHISGTKIADTNRRKKHKQEKYHQRKL